MKNLKRALSLVLSAAMMVGMMVVGTAAADFTDAKGHAHEEAIELMAMIGVMEGDGENFNPDNIVTRNEMAVVMVNLLDLKLNGSHPFTDVASWADKYVGAIYTNGYTAGKSATLYGGTDKITTVEAALMIMKTLGYFEFQGEFGDDWKLATVKRATELGLFEDIEAGINDYLTRGEVAEMVMAALDENVKVAHENGGMTVEGNGITVTEKATYTYTNIDGNKTLAEKLYDNTLVPNENDYDDFGRPATSWTYTGGSKASETITVADEAKIVFTTSKNDKDITKALKGYDYDESKIDFSIDGVAATTPDKADLDTKTGNGVTVEIFADKQSVITDIVVINEYLGKVTAITKADEDADTKRTVTVAGKTYETEDFARKDMVIYTIAGTEIKSMKLAETVEGKVNAKGTDYVKIDGVTYKKNSASSVNFSNSDYKLGNVVNVYVDSNGFVIGLDEVVKSVASVEDYVVVTAIGGDGFKVGNLAKVLYADGTTATLTIDGTAPVIGDKLYTVEKTDDGYEFVEAKAAKDAGYDNDGYTGTNDKDKGKLASTNVEDDAVIFVKKVETGKADKFSVITGAELKKLPNGAVTSIVKAYANDTTSGFASIELAYVVATTTSALDDIAYGYTTAKSEYVQNADDKEVTSITFWDGEDEVTMITTESAKTAMFENDKGIFFKYELNSKGEIASVSAVSGTTAAVKAFDGENILFVNADGSVSAEAKITEDTVIIYVDAENAKGADGEIVLADREYDANGEAADYIENVIYGLDKDEVTFLFVEINNEF